VDALTKTLLNTGHQIVKMSFEYLVINRSTFPGACQEATPLHQSQVIRRGGLRKFTNLSKLIDRVSFARQKELNNLQPTWVRDSLQAFRCHGQGFHVEWFEGSFFVHL